MTSTVKNRSQSDVWLNSRQVAERMGCHPQTIYVMRVEGRGPKWFRVGKNGVRYHIEDVDAYIRAQCGSEY
ncbi:MAG: hypothetical protein CME88_02845 [Hirschia sp.]|nr:hypothetical protein [Hirschia sp.]MBF17300.1 hypothetical protein [Hirschia sp.]